VNVPLSILILSVQPSMKEISDKPQERESVGPFCFTAIFDNASKLRKFVIPQL